MIYVQQGDATVPIVDDHIVVIAHICNNVGAWGNGFEVLLGKAYPQAKREFLEYSKKHYADYLLGEVLWTKISNSLRIANMFAQNGLRSRTNPVPLQMYELRTCLETVFRLACVNNAVVQMPKIGAGLAGGNWTEIYNLIEEVQAEYGIDVYILERSK